MLAAAGPMASVVVAQQPVGATAQLRDAAGQLVGIAEFSEERSELVVKLSLTGSSPSLVGRHAVHIHEVGRCDPPGFLTAGGIFNPTERPHGRRNPDGTEAGDLPNMVVASSGSSEYKAYLAPELTLGSGPGSLLGPGGRALVISAAEDDGRTPPDGNSGARIACGVILAGASGGAPVSLSGNTAGRAAPLDGSPANGTGSSLVIGILGGALVAAGYLLRRAARRPN